MLDLLATLSRISDLVFAEDEQPLRGIRLDRFWHEARKAARLTPSTELGLIQTTDADGEAAAFADWFQTSWNVQKP